MIFTAITILTVLCVRCQSYLPPKIRSEIKTLRSNLAQQVPTKYAHNSFLAGEANVRTLTALQSGRSMPIDAKVSSSTSSRISTKQAILKSMAFLRNLFSFSKPSSPRWIREITRKSRFLIMSVFISAALGMGMGTGTVKKVQAITLPLKQSVLPPNSRRQSSPGRTVTDKIAGKKSVSVELIVSSKSKHDNVIPNLQSEIVAYATHATSAHNPTRSNPGVEAVAEKASKKQLKVQPFGAVELREATMEVKQSLNGLVDSMKGAKLDTLIMLMVTSAVIPIFKRLNLSPILGFLLMGTILGPSCLGAIYDVHTIDVLGELGIVFFLFEMGLELSVARLNAMKKDVFGLGTSQFLVTAAVGSGVSIACGLPTAAAVTIGGSLALSSSAFVLQLLKDKEAMGTRHGKASFGILLLQDLAVVPLLVVVELLAKGGTGLGKALSIAAVKALFTLSVMGVAGKKLLNPIFYYVAKSRSHEAFLSIILTTVLLMSFVTQGIGLSNTLGAFLAGLLLAETKYKYQIEADIAPFRGLLLGFFFITVGFNIDLAMIVKELPKISALLVSLIAGKAAIITALSLAFGMSFANAQLSGLLLAQGGEFAFVALGIAERSGLIAPQLCKLLLTTVALSMAATPMLAEAGSLISRKIEDQRGLTHYLGQDSDAEEMKSESEDFVLVAGYGRVGKMVCDMLDRLPVRYIALDSSPVKAIEARGKGLPVFYGDINRPEVLRNFDVGAARACVFAIGDMAALNKAVINVRKLYPDLPLLIKAKNSQHKQRLETMFENIYVMSPVFQEDSVLLTLPFGGAVLRTLGMSQPEVEAILEDFRRMHTDDDSFNDDTVNFLNSYVSRKGEVQAPVVIEKKEKDKDKEDRHDRREGGSWDGTEEQERQEEEQEMHEYSRISRILAERSSKEGAKKATMNGMIGGVEETAVAPTDAPVSFYLDGSAAVAEAQDDSTIDLEDVDTPPLPTWTGAATGAGSGAGQAL